MSYGKECRDPDEYWDEEVLTLSGDYLSRREIARIKTERRHEERDKRRGVTHYSGAYDDLNDY